MSVAEILQQIEALPKEERKHLVEKLVLGQGAEGADSLVPKLSEAEQADLEHKLKRRPNLGAEMAQIIERMQAGNAVDLEEAIALHEKLEKLGL